MRLRATLTRLLTPFNLFLRFFSRSWCGSAIPFRIGCGATAQGAYGRFAIVCIRIFRSSGRFHTQRCYGHSFADAVLWYLVSDWCEFFVFGAWSRHCDHHAGISRIFLFERTCGRKGPALKWVSTCCLFFNCLFGNGYRHNMVWSWEYAIAPQLLIGSHDRIVALLALST